MGLGLNILVLGATTLAARAVLGGRSQADIPGFPKLPIPVLADLPLIGPALFGQIGLVYAGIALVPLTWMLLRRTAFGLAVDAVGTDPRAADKTSISVNRTRYAAALWAGLCAGLGGVFMSVGDVHTFTEGMTNGVGYLALVAVIFGNWSVARTAAACLLFGAATALQFQVPALGIDIPIAIIVMFPYVVALFAVTGLMGRQHPPLALAIPFSRGR